LFPDATVRRTYHYAAFGCAAADDCSPAASFTTLTPTLVQALRAGGYTIYFRHAVADVCIDKAELGPAATTTSPDWWKSCDANCDTATARQLSQTVGVADAKAIGAAFDALAIPVGRVIASEFCRARTTAQLMDLGPTIEQSAAITSVVYDESKRCANVQSMIAEPPPAGANTAIVAHTNFTCATIDQLDSGEAAVFKPNGKGGSTFIARVLPIQWKALQ
jgi:phosphohistidine phosphatase SixA